MVHSHDCSALLNGCSCCLPSPPSPSYPFICATPLPALSSFPSLHLCRNPEVWPWLVSWKTKAKKKISILVEKKTNKKTKCKITSWHPLSKQAIQFKQKTKQNKKNKSEAEWAALDGTIWAVLGKALLSLPCLRLRPPRLLVPTWAPPPWDSAWPPMADP